MRTAEEILIELSPYGDLGFLNSEVAINAMKEYAKQAIEEQLGIAADEATTRDLLHEEDGKKIFVCEEVNPDSILNCTRIELT